MGREARGIGSDMKDGMRQADASIVTRHVNQFKDSGNKHTSSPQLPTFDHPSLSHQIPQLLSIDPPATLGNSSRIFHFFFPSVSLPVRQLGRTISVPLIKSLVDSTH